MSSTRISHRYTINILLLFGSILLAGCNRSPQPIACHPGVSLNALLFHEIQKKQIVLLGDPYPGHATYLELVSSFLKYWLGVLKRNPADTSQPRRLILVLEQRPEAIQAMNSYFVDGNQRTLLRVLLNDELRHGSRDFSSTELSVDFLQFIDELRSVKAAIGALNFQHADSPISFALVGAEPPAPDAVSGAPQENQMTLDQFRTRGHSHDRTVEISERLNRCLTEHPGYKMLLLYGTNFLWRTKSELPFSLVHCLDSLAGWRNVAVFQTSRMAAHRNAQDNYAIDPATAVEEYLHDGTYEDFIVRQDVKPAYPFPLSVLKSVNLLGAYYDLAEQYSRSDDPADRFTARRLMDSTFLLLQRSYLKRDPTMNFALQKAARTLARLRQSDPVPSRVFSVAATLVSQFNPVEDILSMDKTISDASVWNSTDYMTMILRVLDNLPPQSPAPRDLLEIQIPRNIEGTPQPSQWALKWKYRKPEILAYLLVELLSLGTEQEVHEGIKALQFITKQDYQTPDEWRQWWRAKYFE